VNRVRRPPLEHPLAKRFEQAVESLGAALHPDTVRHYRGTVRKFLTWLGARHPEVCALDQLQRKAHILPWLTHLQSQRARLVTTSYINLLIHLRGIFHELAWTEQLPELAHLLRREDVPRMPQRLPRPLTAQQDEILQRELLRRNDVGANALLLIRHTGMRIGECADLPCDCLRSTGPHQWAIHVPLGKLKTERMVPVDSFVCELVQRLRFFRSLDSVPADGLLLPRPHTKEALVRQLRDYLHEVCFSVSLPVAIVPHQLRHTYATEMLRSGVSFPGVMKLLGHNSSDMTMKYLDIALPDLQREFHSARLHPRHLAPQPKVVAASVRSGINGVIDSFLAAQHALAMFRRAEFDNAVRRSLHRLSNRLTKIPAELRNLNPPSK
jgi:site-specific recombinase XerD